MPNFISESILNKHNINDIQSSKGRIRRFAEVSFLEVASGTRIPSIP
jgi:hypothetical protein